MYYSKIELGKRIKKKRNDFHYTIEKLSELLNITPRFLSAIENGDRGISFTTLEKMCNILCVTSDYLLFGKNTYSNENKEISNITEILLNLDKQYIPLAENLIFNFNETVSLVTKKTLEK